MRTRTWPGGYRTGHCLGGDHRRCKYSIWSPGAGKYVTCACKECDHEVAFDEEAEEEFFSDVDERDPFVFEPGEQPKVWKPGIIVDEDEEEEEFFQPPDEEEEEEEFF